MSGNSIVLEKAKNFAVRIVRLSNFLKNEKREHTISTQVLRSGTSIGANITEALCGISRKDFQAKMYIALKECAETLYWLQLLRDTAYITPEQHASIQADCEAIRKMLSSITRTISASTEKGKSDSKTKN